MTHIEKMKSSVLENFTDADLVCLCCEVCVTDEKLCRTRRNAENSPRLTRTANQVTIISVTLGWKPRRRLLKKKRKIK